MKSKTEILRQYNKLFQLFGLPAITGEDVVAFMGEDGINSLVFALNFEVTHQVQNTFQNYFTVTNQLEQSSGLILKLNADLMTWKSSAEASARDYNKVADDYRTLSLRKDEIARINDALRNQVTDLQDTIEKADKLIQLQSTECDTMKTQLDLAKRMLVAKQTDISDKEGCMAEMTQELDRLNQKLARKQKRSKLTKIDSETAIFLSTENLWTTWGRFVEMNDDISNSTMNDIKRALQHNKSYKLDCGTAGVCVISLKAPREKKLDKPVVHHEQPEWQQYINHIIGTESLCNFYPDDKLFGDFDQFYRRVGSYIHNMNDYIKRDTRKGAIHGRLHQHWNWEELSPRHSRITVVFIFDD